MRTGLDEKSRERRASGFGGRGHWLRHPRRARRCVVSGESCGERSGAGQAATNLCPFRVAFGGVRHRFLSVRPPWDCCLHRYQSFQMWAFGWVQRILDFAKFFICPFVQFHNQEVAAARNAVYLLGLKALSRSQICCERGCCCVPSLIRSRLTYR